MSSSRSYFQPYLLSAGMLSLLMANGGCSEGLPIGNSGYSSRAPVLEQLTPAAALSDRDTWVKLSGKGFSAQSRILLDGCEISPSALLSEDSLAASFPDRQGVGGPVSVTVVNPDGQKSEPKIFYYAAPTISWQQQFYSTGGPLSAVASWDLDHDQMTDLVIGPNDDPLLSMLYGRRRPMRMQSPWPLRLLSSDVHAVAVGERRLDTSDEGRVLIAQTHPGLHTVEVVQGDGLTRWDNEGGRSFETGTYPTALLVVDLDHDGNPDLVVVNTEDDDISVLLGVADSRLFLPQQRYATCKRPQALAAGDLDADGLTDLAVACTDSGEIHVLFGDREKGLRSGPLIKSGQSAYGVVVADLNHDEQLDLVVADAATAELVVLLGRGSAEFSPPKRYAVGPGPLAVTAVDLNGDGVPDLASANYFANSVSLLIGEGDGSFGRAVSTPVRKGPIALVSGDFDGDGKPDLAVSSILSALVTVLINTRP